MRTLIGPSLAVIGGVVCVMVGACGSTAVAPVWPTPVDDPRTHAGDPVGLADDGFLVLPAQATATPRDAPTGVALSALFIHMMAVHPAFEPGTARGPIGPWPQGSDPRAWQLGGPPLPQWLGGHSARWVLMSRIVRAGEARTLHLRLLDRAQGNHYDRSAPIVTPRLWEVRMALLRVLTDAGKAPPERQRGAMLWLDELDAGSLDGLGAALLARAAPAPGAAQPVTWPAGDHSYVIQAERAGTGCSFTAEDALTSALALNPSGYAAAERLGSCSVKFAADLRELIRAEKVSCGISGKGLMSSLSARRVRGSGVLTGVGGVYGGTSCTMLSIQALSAGMRSLPLAHRALAHEQLGIAYQAAGDLDAAGTALMQGLELRRELGDGAATARALLRLGDLRLQEARHDEALALFTEAQELASASQAPLIEGRVLNSAALVYLNQGRYDEAVGRLKAAHARFEALGDDGNLGVTLANLGSAATLMGDYEEAERYYLDAAHKKQITRSAGGEATTRNGLGTARMAQGKVKPALHEFEAATALTDDDGVLASVKNNMGQVRVAMGDLDGAAVDFNEALDAGRRTHQLPIQGVALHNLASVAQRQGRLDEALAKYKASLVIRRRAGDRSGEGLTLNDLMYVLAARGERDQAILMGKLAVRAHDDVREGIAGAEAQERFAKTREATYRRLGELLIEAGRLAEAEEVVGQLRAEEFTRWAARGPAEAKALRATDAEQVAQREYAALADEVMALAAEYGRLSRTWHLTPEERARLQELQAKLEAANAAFIAFIDGLAAVEDPDRLNMVKEGTAIGADLAELGPDVVALYTLMGEDALRMIVVSGDAQVAVQSDVSAAELRRLIGQFRAVLQDPAADPLPLAGELYDHIIAPIRPHLDKAGAKTLMVALDRTLRYLPLSALHDGEQYLIERYRVARFTPASRTRLKDAPNPVWRILGLGVSKKFPGFDALPSVAEELGAIVDNIDTDAADGIFPGHALLNADFTRDALFDGLRRRFPVVHMASHFTFASGDKSASFLLLGDGQRLNVGEIERLPNVFAGVDLLMLSACATGIGDPARATGEEVESFAVLAQRKGAKAVIASLWAVSDQSTSLMMRLFYALRRAQPALPKTEALRLAQVELVRGRTTAPAPGSPPVLTAPTDGLTAATYGHPYYWAPFVLIGNWR